jgi:hypothetical protein
MVKEIAGSPHYQNKITTVEDRKVLSFQLFSMHPVSFVNSNTLLIALKLLLDSGSELISVDSPVNPYAGLLEVVLFLEPISSSSPSRTRSLLEQSLVSRRAPMMLIAMVSEPLLGDSGVGYFCIVPVEKPLLLLWKQRQAGYHERWLACTHSERETISVSSLSIFAYSLHR